jgi:ABC-2 type transport system ATP-binding protein
MNSAIRTTNLEKRFRRVTALSGLNCDVQSGSIYALVGPNGAGKTTIIKILMNIIPPTSGTAEVLGLDCRKLSGRVFAEIGYVSENQEIPEWMMIRSLLEYLRPFYPQWDADLELSLVRQLDLPLDRKIGALSRGTKMKVALATSLAYHPKLIVLDEPFGGLDPLVRDQLIEALLERAQESTIFISSHDLAEVETFASHVGFLDCGQLLFSEEMGVLSSRFREVELTLESAQPLPSRLPKDWIQMEVSGVVIRFVDCSFQEERTNSQIKSLFGDVRECIVRPMSLRAIFLAIAKIAKADRT